LPGPASSQVAFALGLIRGKGLAGGLAASVAFTAPSATAMLILALGIGFSHGPFVAALLHGLKLVAVAVVAQAVWGMARAFTPDRPRIAIALLAVVITTLLGGGFSQLLAIGLGACLGLLLIEAGETRQTGEVCFALPRQSGIRAILLFGGLLLLLPLFSAIFDWQALRLFSAFYRSGALVFGGGHIVLPLLQTEVVAPGWVTSDSFLTGYGLAQAMPGPLFTLATYLGAVTIPSPHGLTGAAIATIAIFLPGLLLVYGMLPFWTELRAKPNAQAAMSGTNAAVVGLLGAALYNPVWVGAVNTPYDFLLALTGFLLCTIWKLPSVAIVILLPALSVIKVLFIAS
jgi:chromate transporter